MEMYGDNNSVQILSTQEDIPPPTDGETDKEEPPIPEGTVYPLNSKRLVTQQLQRLVGMLNLPMTASSSSTLQLLEGKLLELGHESKNVQVIVSDDGGKLYLVSNIGVISAETEHANVRDAINELSHVTHSESSADELESLCSAL